MLNNVGTICSILGLLVSLWTLYKTWNVRHAMSDYKKNILFRKLSSEYLYRFRSLNLDFVKNIDSGDIETLRNSASRLRSILNLIQRNSPKDIRNRCKAIDKDLKLKENKLLSCNLVSSDSFFSDLRTIYRENVILIDLIEAELKELTFVE